LNAPDPDSHGIFHSGPQTLASPQPSRHHQLPQNSFRPTVYLPDPCLPRCPTSAKSEIWNRKSPIKSVWRGRPRPRTGLICTEFSTRARKHEHHPNLVGITSSRRTVFVPLFTFLILACLDDPHPQNLKSGISNLRSSPCGAGALARELVQSEISNLKS